MADDLAVAAGQAFDRPALPVPGSPNPTVPAVRSLSASARRIRLDTPAGRRKIRKPRELYEKVWDLRKVAEASFAIRFMGNAMSRVRLEPALIVDPTEAPINMFDAVDDPEIRLPERFALDAAAELDRLTGGPGGQPSMMQAFGQSLMGVGDSYMLGRAATDDDETIEDEVWSVYSPSNLVKDQASDALRVKEAPDERGELVPDDSLLYRIWRRDPQWPAWADSGFFSIIDELEELLVISRQFRAVSRSRSAAGLLLIPSELDPQATAGQRALPPGEGQTVPTADGADQAPVSEWTPFDLALIKSLITPTEDDGSAAQVVPHIIKGVGTVLEQIRHLDLGRMIDPETIKRADGLVRTIAHGVDLPVEVLTGLADSNHWNVWFIGDDTYRAHVEPTAQIPASGLAAVHLRPALLENWPRDLVRLATFGLDPSQLVVRPNRAADAKDAHDRIVISDAAYRKYLSMPDSDAPDEKEMARRLALKRGSVSPEITAQLLEQTEVVDEPLEVTAGGGAPGSPGSPNDDGDPDAPIDGGEPTPGARSQLAITAASSIQLPDLGGRLGAIEARLLDRLQVAASDAAQQALDRAGSRLRSAVQHTPELRDEVNGIPADQVGLVLGSARAPVVDPDQLLAGAFVGLRSKWDTWVDQAEAEAAAAVRTALGDQAAIDASLSEQADPGIDHEAGWSALLLALTAYVGPLIFKAADTELGEIDLSVRIPAGLIRDALSVAGGGTANAAPFGTAAQSGPPGMLTGPRWRLVLQRLNVVASGWTWAVGFPSVPFEPHQRLDGVEFQAWDGDELSNGAPFPRTSHYFPGDHRGCQCQTYATLVQTASTLPQEAAA